MAQLIPLSTTQSPTPPDCLTATPPGGGHPSSSPLVRAHSLTSTSTATAGLAAPPLPPPSPPPSIPLPLLPLSLTLPLPSPPPHSIHRASLLPPLPPSQTSCVPPDHQGQHPIDQPSSRPVSSSSFHLPPASGCTVTTTPVACFPPALPATTRLVRAQQAAARLSAHQQPSIVDPPTPVLSSASSSSSTNNTNLTTPPTPSHTIAPYSDSYPPSSTTSRSAADHHSTPAATSHHRLSKLRLLHRLSHSFSSLLHHQTANSTNTAATHHAHTPVTTPESTTLIESPISCTGSTALTPASTTTSPTPPFAMHFSSSPPSTTQLDRPEEDDRSSHPIHCPSPAPSKLTQSRRHSFFKSGLTLGLRHRTSTRFNSAITLAAYPNQQSHPLTIDSMTKRPSLLGPSRVIAIVGNVRSGLGRMILEEIVAKKFIVVALIDKPDPVFSRSVESLANSPSCFHAFVVEGGLFSKELIETLDIGKDQRLSPTAKLAVDQPLYELEHQSTPLSPPPPKSGRTFRLVGRRKQKLVPSPANWTDSRSSSTNASTSLRSSSNNSSIPLSHSQQKAQQQIKSKSRMEIARILQAYRVDTVICSFEPQLPGPPTPSGPRAEARLMSEEQHHLPLPLERKRIEAMERLALEASIESGSVGRFAVTIHSTSVTSDLLSPPPTDQVPAHLRITDHAINPISITEFRSGFLMNELASDPSLFDGVTAENGLGRYLIEPPRFEAHSGLSSSSDHGRWLIDFDHKQAWIPVSASPGCTSSADQPGQRLHGHGKGKQKPEPLCLTLAEDVARFVGLACKLREPWEWNTGRMVGDCLKGGWEEMVEMVEYVSKTSLERKYVRSITTDPESGGAYPSPTEKMATIYPSQQPRAVEGTYRFDDRLRARLAAEGLDASSVRFAEFARVWFTPLLQPPAIKLDGSRVRKATKSMGAHRAMGSNSPEKTPGSEERRMKNPTALLHQSTSSQSTTSIMSGHLSAPPTHHGSKHRSLTGSGLAPPAGRATFRPKPPQEVQEFNFVPNLNVPVRKAQVSARRVEDESELGRSTFGSNGRQHYSVRVGEMIGRRSPLATQVA